LILKKNLTFEFVLVESLGGVGRRRLGGMMPPAGHEPTIGRSKDHRSGRSGIAGTNTTHLLKHRAA